MEYRRLLPVLSLAAGLLGPAVGAQTTWAPHAQFDGQLANGLFGTAMAGVGDVDGDGVGDLAVGEPGVFWGSPTAGAVYVYSGASGALLHHFQGAAVQEMFGESVAGAGDVDADGFDDIIVGAWNAAPGGQTQAGSAFVYSGATGALLHRFDGAYSSLGLGESVGGAGDVDDDGHADLVVGIPRADPNGIQNAGTVQVYSGATGALLHEFHGTASYDLLGWSVAGAGDLDGDDHDDILAGAPSASPNGIYGAGSLLVYSGATGAVLARLDGTAQYAEVGRSVASAGDVDADGTPDILAGGALYGDRALVYSGATFALLHQLVGATGFGIAVAGAGDVDGDGVDDFAVGASTSSTGWNGGAVQVVSGATGLQIAEFEGPNSGGDFGVSVAGVGDIDGDGWNDLAVGDPLASPGGLLGAGSAYLIVDPPSTNQPPGPYAWVENPANGHWYALVNAVDWAAATAEADQYPDVELATVRDLAEQDWLFQVLMGGAGIAYIGLEDEAVEGDFRWRSGELTPWWANNGYTGVGGEPGYWYFQEPNNLNDEDYVTLGRPGASGGNGEWNDTNGQTLRDAILEWAPPPPPPVLAYTGTCPGGIQANGSGFTPGGGVALVWGYAGTTPVQAAACGTVVLDLVQPSLLFVATADPAGGLQFSANLPAAACGSVRAQALDLVSCSLTAAVQL